MDWLTEVTDWFTELTDWLIDWIDWLIGRHPVHMQQVGWSRLLSTTDLMAYKHTYWKMTNLNQNWRKGSRSDSVANESKDSFFVDQLEQVRQCSQISQWEHGIVFFLTNKSWWDSEANENKESFFLDQLEQVRLSSQWEQRNLFSWPIKAGETE